MYKNIIYIEFIGYELDLVRLKKVEIQENGKNVLNFKNVVIIQINVYDRSKNLFLVSGIVESILLDGYIRELFIIYYCCVYFRRNFCYFYFLYI